MFRCVIAFCCVWFLSSCGVELGSPRPTVSLTKNVQGNVVSVDYCADQYALRLLPRSRILALSRDSREYFSHHRALAHGIPQVDSRAENVLLLAPDIILRSFGGGPNATAFFDRADIEVVQLDYPTTIDAIKSNIIDVALALGVEARGREVVQEFERRLGKLARARQTEASALYVTPGGVTTGPGSLVDDVITRAGYSNFFKTPGWHDLPLEQLVYEQPDLAIVALFGHPKDHVDPWTVARHPLIKDALLLTESVELDGALTACAAWYVSDAIEALLNRTPEASSD